MTIIKLNLKRFIVLTGAGSILWVLSFLLAGYSIGMIPALKPWLNYFVIGFLVIITVPLLIWVFKELNRIKKNQQQHTE